MCEKEYTELTSAEIASVLNSAGHCVLGVAENDQPYLIPMYYTWEKCKKHLVFKLLSEESGEKMRCMKNNPRVGLEFEKAVSGGMQTVTVKGIVTGFEEEKCACSCCTYMEITIMAVSVSGREYNSYVCEGVSERLPRREEIAVNTTDAEITAESESIPAQTE